jgi:GntR family transcriptional regulator
MPGTEPLARDSHVAMYRQIASRLRQAIARGEYKIGSRIPTEPEIGIRYRVSRITARQAVDALAREGLVTRKQGKGTFVTGPLVHHDLLDLRGIYDGLVAQGLNPRTRLLGFGRSVPPQRIATRLGTSRRKLFHWRRLFLLGDDPLAVAEAYVNTGRARLSREKVDQHPTYSILEEQLHQHIARADVSIRYTQASPEFARHLKIATGAALIAFERVSYNADSVPLEHSLYYARAEAYEFSLTVRGKVPFTRYLKAASTQR